MEEYDFDETYRGAEGRKLCAEDVAERLIPDLGMAELLLWPPDLFAFTSYLLSLTGAYQLVVSPPSGERWQPSNEEIMRWIGVSYDSAAGKFCKGDISENVEKWLRLVLRESVDAEKITELFSKKEYEKWGLNSDGWTLGTNKGLLDSALVSAIKRIPYFEEKLSQLGEVIADFAFQNLSTDGDNGLSDKYAPKDESEENPDATVEKGSPKFLSEYLKNPEQRNWVELVQMAGDHWNHNLSSITKEEFYVINDAELTRKGREMFEESGLSVGNSTIPRGEQAKQIQWGDARINGVLLNERYNQAHGHKLREEDLFGILIKYTPPLLIAIWAFFHKEVCAIRSNNRKLPISKLLCNRDDLLDDDERGKLWQIAQAVLTMHAIADICCTGWGIRPETDLTKDKQESDTPKNRAKWFAEKMLFDKGSLATINPARGRVLPKRHNPSVGITLRSISSNVGFHRSSVDVVWRKAKNNDLERDINNSPDATFSLLLVPHPLDIRGNEFPTDELANGRVNFDDSEYSFFGWRPSTAVNPDRILSLIERAQDELRERSVDMIVFPEVALSKDEYEVLEKSFAERLKEKAPSVFVAGVRESRLDVLEEHLCRTENDFSNKLARIREIENALKNSSELTGSPNRDDLERELKELTEHLEQQVNFPRNAVYTKYFDLQRDDDGSLRGFNIGSRSPRYVNPKYKQYKHHRWKLDASQIIRYGLSQHLDPEKTWWESIKVPQRRVSFLNIGKRITITSLVCEDLARQDPIADLIRHVGPSIVVTLLMDGPQVRGRWSGRYASILSDDPGCSVITLTSLGMVKRDNSFGLSRVIGLWSQSHGERVQEIGIAEGAEAVLLVLKLHKERERTADGRRERVPTSVVKLQDIIQIYPDATPRT